jgi:hypothetical protein
MRSTQALILMVCALSISGCKKHEEAAAASDAGTDGGTDADTDAGGAGSPASDAATEDAAAVLEAGPPASTTPDVAPSGASFAGTFDCWGGTMTLTQTGTQVTGDAHIPLGTATQTTEVLCTIGANNRCVGQATYFTQKAGHEPKPAGKGKVILTAQSTGLRYTTMHGGKQEGFCPRR